MLRKITFLLAAAILSLTACKKDIPQVAIIFKLNGGTIAENEEDRVYYGIPGSTVEFEMSAPKKDGFIFSGWEPQIPTVFPENNLIINATYGKDPGYVDPNAGPAKPAEILIRYKSSPQSLNDNTIETVQHTTVPIIAEILPANAAQEIEWSSSSKYIEIKENGEIYARYDAPANHIGTITAKSKEDPSITASLNIKILTNMNIKDAIYKGSITDPGAADDFNLGIDTIENFEVQVNPIGDGSQIYLSLPVAFMTGYDVPVRFGATCNIDTKTGVLNGVAIDDKSNYWEIHGTLDHNTIYFKASSMDTYYMIGSFEYNGVFDRPADKLM